MLQREYLQTNATPINKPGSNLDTARVNLFSPDLYQETDGNLRNLEIEKADILDTIQSTQRSANSRLPVKKTR